MKKNSSLILLSICILISFSCKDRKTYLEKAISDNIIITPLIYTKDSAIILISSTSERMISELKKNPEINNVKEFLCKAMKNGLPIGVTNRFYRENSNFRIYADSMINTIYNKQGISGLLNAYFKYDGIYIISSISLQNESSYTAFGQNSNVDYIAYLLFKHNIFLTYRWLDEDGILMTIIATNFSDMSEIKDTN